MVGMFFSLTVASPVVLLAALAGEVKVLQSSLERPQSVHHRIFCLASWL